MSSAPDSPNRSRVRSSPLKLQLSPAEESSLKSIRLHLTRPSPGSVSGTHRGMHSGRGIEFHEFRPYTPGEDLRHLDWRTVGRTG
ncbi:MAG: DUF58 domain-containing protein, partial [Spirochaetia bacterium]|nr:DUF58 domain-containing protein [Spirochaetia bacterium]